MRAAVYARYSSHRQGEQSIEGQLAEAQKYAAAHGLTILREYCDRAQTGRNDNREQFQRMLADAAKHDFDALIVWKTDRIGRNKEEIALNKYHLKKNGVKIHYIAEMIPDTPEGIILEAVIEGMAAYYSEQLSQNVRRGLLASASKAQSTGGKLPLGYITGPDKKLMIDPKTAPTVRLIFELYAQGKTITQVVQLLNEKGLRTRNGQPFSHNSLNVVLKNEKYIGVYSYNNEVRIEDAVPPIVEPELFYKVQKMLKHNQRMAAHKNSKADYLLTGKLFCGKCGAMMVGVSGTSKTGVRHHYYYCKEQRLKRCDKKSVRKEWIEELVLEQVVGLVRNGELLDFIAEKTYQYYLEQNTDSAYTESLRKALAEVEKSIGNLVKALEAGIFNDETKRRMDELSGQKAELQDALGAAKLREDLGLKKEHIAYFLHRFADMDYTDENCQKLLIQTFVNSVFVYDGKVVLTFNYSGDDRTITLHEIDAVLQQGVHLPQFLCHQGSRRLPGPVVRQSRMTGPFLLQQTACRALFRRQLLFPMKFCFANFHGDPAALRAVLPQASYRLRRFFIKNEKLPMRICIWARNGGGRKHCRRLFQPGPYIPFPIFQSTPIPMAVGDSCSIPYNLFFANTLHWYRYILTLHKSDVTILINKVSAFFTKTPEVKQWKNTWLMSEETQPGRSSIRKLSASTTAIQPNTPPAP